MFFGKSSVRELSEKRFTIGHSHSRYMTPEVYWRASLLSPRGTGGEGVGRAKFTHIGADRDIFTHIGHHIRPPQAENFWGYYYVLYGFL